MILQKVLDHKKLSASILFFVMLGAYWTYSSLASDTIEVSYTTSPIGKGTLIATVSGSGQVSVAERIDLSPQLSGKVVAIPVENNQQVTAGTIIAQLETKDIEKEIRDAEINLQSAQISLQKLRQPADSLSLLQSQNSLDQALRSLEDVKNPPDELEIFQAKNTLQKTIDTLEKLKLTQKSEMEKATEATLASEVSLEKIYEDIYNQLSITYVDLPEMISASDNFLYGSDIDKAETSINKEDNKTALLNTTYHEDRTPLEESMKIAEEKNKESLNLFNKSLERYKTFSRESEREMFETLLTETIETVQTISETTKYELLILNEWTDLRKKRNYETLASVEALRATVSDASNTMNNHLTSLLNNQRTLSDGKTNLLSSERTLKEAVQNQPLDLASAEQDVIEKRESLKDLENGPDESDLMAAEENVRERTQALEDLKKGADPLDIASQELTIRQRQISLNDARDKLADAYIRAPYDGIVTEINAHVGDNVSSGTILATVLSHQKIAEISLNEVDIVKIQKEQKVTLTFDAIDDLSISGAVKEVDTLGTISSGVVTYGVLIVFDTDDERVRPGMSVSTEIITAVRQDVLTVPSAAIKYLGDEAAVEILQRGNPVRQPIVIGISNDSSTEVISGLEEGQEIITATSQSGGTQTASPAASGGLRIPGLGGGGGGRGFGGGG